MRKKSSKNRGNVALGLINKESPLGAGWLEIFSAEVDFESSHFEKALYNLILQPEINSTVLLRADIMKNTRYLYSSGKPEVFEDVEVNQDGDFRLNLRLEKVLKEVDQKGEKEKNEAESREETILERDLSDLEVREIPVELKFKPKRQIVRRLIPRNPFKDYIINQTCLLLKLDESSSEATAGTDQQPLNAQESLLVVYVPHIKSSEECPYYLPPVYAVGIYYDKSAKKLSLNYLPFQYTNPQVIEDFQKLDSNDRTIRIAYRLLQTAMKHSKGVMNGYEKRVQHDLLVPKVLFQNRYIALKKKYSQYLIDNWQENTDPKKHVFEDIAIAAFLVELWSKIYAGKKRDEFQFADLGCGNGILVYILIQEGYRGIGVDARSRKSWKIYPQNVTDNLKEQVIIPGILLRPHPSIKSLAPQVTDNGRIFQIPLQNSTFKTNMHGLHNHRNIDKQRKLNNGNSSDIVGNGVAENPLPDPVVQDNVPVFAYYNSATLLNSSYVNTAEFPPNTFIIGNHSDELTLWIPLFGYDFMVIPCCSHALSGKRARYLPKRQPGKDAPVSTSSYSGLVQHAEELANKFGWKTEKEMLRIPSTRNCALVGYQRYTPEEVKSAGLNLMNIYEIVTADGGAEGWVENAMSLMKEPPRTH